MSESTFREQVSSYLARQRWSGQGGTEVAVTDIEALEWLRDPSAEVGVRIELVRAGALYNMPLSYRSELREDLSYGYVGIRTYGGSTYHVYDALHDPQARSVVLAGFGAGVSAPSNLEYHRMEGWALEPDADSVLMTVEQSNTSIIVGEALVKVFRTLAAGRNPDVDVHRALTAAGSEEISPLLGWLSAGDYDLAMASEYERSATDGWDAARASVRALHDDAMRARDAGGDFAGECERLGATLGAVHQQLRDAFPTQEWGRSQIAELVDRLTTRLESAAASNATVAQFAEQARAAYGAIDSESVVRAQRVHGDFHLGQTLRTTSGWKIIDFEGEPSQPVADRVQLDSPARDVAGLLRSLDYAAHSVELVTDSDDTSFIDDWVRRNRIAFLRGYGHEPTDAEAALLHAYQVDKAIYEVMYESKYRPGWVHIPVGALHRLLGSADVMPD